MEVLMQPQQQKQILRCLASMPAEVRWPDLCGVPCSRPVEKRTPLFWFLEQHMAEDDTQDTQDTIRQFDRATVEATSRLLLKHRADINATHGGRTLLHVAARLPHPPALIDMLLALGTTTQLHSTYCCNHAVYAFVPS